MVMTWHKNCCLQSSGLRLKQWDKTKKQTTRHIPNLLKRFLQIGKHKRNYSEIDVNLLVCWILHQTSIWRFTTPSFGICTTVPTCRTSNASAALERQRSSVWPTSINRAMTGTANQRLAHLIFPCRITDVRVVVSFFLLIAIRGKQNISPGTSTTLITKKPMELFQGLKKEKMIQRNQFPTWTARI